MSLSGPSLHPLGCGFTFHDGEAEWNFNFTEIGRVRADAAGDLFSYYLSPCGISEHACRPTLCFAGNASECEPYDPDLPQHGAAIQYAAHSPWPKPPWRADLRCFEEGTNRSVEAECTRACNVLAPVGASPGLSPAVGGGRTRSRPAARTSTAGATRLTQGC